jgi:hypothetical protein
VLQKKKRKKKLNMCKKDIRNNDENVGGKIL